MARRFVLASASPARLQTLRAAGFTPEVVVSGVAEDDVRGEAATVVATLARRKAEAVPVDNALVLGCDSLLEHTGMLLGKPGTAVAARARWQQLRGTNGILHTGHCLIDTATGRRAEAVAATTVRFGTPSDAEIDAYVATGEPLAVAGAFTIDGRGAAFVDGIDGDAGTVIGVSIPLFRNLCSELEIEMTSLWA
ncbi:MAG TPA: Maf family protein [Acidimicrobiia bacterium]|nr:Maf family protein [Acidimicrobiia bacterium]